MQFIYQELYYMIFNDSFMNQSPQFQASFTQFILKAK